MPKQRPHAKPPTTDEKSASTEARFPAQQHVRAFAEQLLGRQPEGTFQTVESEKSSAPGSAASHRAREAHPRAPNSAPEAKTFRCLDDDAHSTDREVGRCLSEATVGAFAEGRLDRAELVTVHEHLDSCRACQHLIAAATLTESSPTRDLGQGSLEPGTILCERYRIQRFVARGGMGEVYEAYDRVLRERVALKTVAATVTDSPKAVRRLMAEVQLARRVSHPNACRIYDLGAHRIEGRPTLHFLTMEFVDGITLCERLERHGPLPTGEAVEIARQLLSGLQAAHEAGILHRDFKPDNVMLRPASGERVRAVIMDFGLARAMEMDPARLTTGANQPLVGTLAYMAPEQVEGGALDCRTDLFAFGVVLFEMLTGCLPFLGSSPAATALMRLKERAPLPSKHAPDVPELVDKMVLKCLARHPEDRYASAEQALAALSRPAPASSRRPPRRGDNRIAIAAIAAVACLAVAFGLWSRFSSATPDTPTDAERAERLDERITVHASTVTPTHSAAGSAMGEPKLDAEVEPPPARQSAEARPKSVAAPPKRSVQRRPAPPAPSNAGGSARSPLPAPTLSAASVERLEKTTDTAPASDELLIPSAFQSPAARTAFPAAPHVPKP